MTYLLGNKTYRNILFAVIVGFGIAFSFFISVLSYQADERLLWAQFTEATENRYSALKRELESNLDALESLQALYYASGKNVKRSEFRDFSGHILKQHASIQALEWIPRVPDARREAYERAVQEEGFPDFQITERIAQGKMKRAEKRKEYFPVYFVEPHKGNEIALGFDLASNPTRLEALEAAEKTGKMLATARITLVQEKINQNGFIVFAPVYSKRALLDSDRTRADALEGFALGVFRLNDIVEKAMSYLKPEGVDFFIYDASAPEKERFLYTHESRTRKTPMLNKEQPETDLQDTKTIEVAGRKWQIIYSAGPGYIAARRSSRHWIILFTGLALTSLVAGFQFSSTRHAKKVEKSAKDLSDTNAKLSKEIMERKQAESELILFKNLINRANDLILVVDPETGRLVDVNDEACKALGYGREDLLEMTALDIAAPVIGDLSLWRAHVEEVKDKGNMVLTARQRRKDGTTFPVEINVSYISLEAEDYMVAIIRDITARKHSEEQLRESEERYRQLVELSPDAIYIQSEGKIAYINAAGVKLFGAEHRTRLLGMQVLELMHPDYRKIVQERILKLREDKTEVPLIEEKYLRLDGTSVDVEVAATPFIYQDKPAAQVIARNITERKLSEEKIKQQFQQMLSLRSIDLAISTTLDIRLTLDIFLEQVVSQLHVDAASVLLLNPHTRLLEFTAMRGFRTQALKHTRMRLGEGNAGIAALNRSIVHVSDVKNDEAFSRSPLIPEEQFVCYFGVPLIAKGEVKGVLEIFHRSSLHSDQGWQDFLESLALQAAIAIDNATLYENLEKSNLELVMAYDSTIEGWSRALDYRDKETEGHSQRVTELAVKICQAMGMTDWDLTYARWGALLHDIGKLGVPDNILFKPGKFDDAEWKIMKRHPVLAYELLEPIRYLGPAIDIPYCHHEKWDGTGYPRGLKGEQIPLAARIFSIVDVWDALGSDRPYRAAWPKEKIFQYLRDQTGKDFDPNVTEIFVKLLNEGG